MIKVLLNCLYLSVSATTQPQGSSSSWLWGNAATWCLGPWTAGEEAMIPQSSPSFWKTPKKGGKLNCSYVSFARLIPDHWWVQVTWSCSRLFLLYMTADSLWMSVDAASGGHWTVLLQPSSLQPRRERFADGDRQERRDGDVSDVCLVCLLVENNAPIHRAGPQDYREAPLQAGAD